MGGWSTLQTSRNYALAQSALFCVFAAVFFLDAGPPLFPSGGLPGAIGVVLCLAGLLLLLSAFASIRGAIQIAPEPRPGARLVTRGVYRRLRHPIYTAIVILVVGLFLRKPTVLIGIGAAVVIAFLVLKARFEEKLLLMRYSEYAEYKKRTWGILLWSHRSRTIR